MIQRLPFGLRRMALALAVAISAGIFPITPAAAQSPQMEQKLMAIKEAQAANKQKLAQYTWTETESIAIKGDVKDTKTYQVQMVNGQQQKTLVNDQKASSGGGREGRAQGTHHREGDGGIPTSTASPSARWPSSTPRPIPTP